MTCLACWYPYKSTLPPPGALQSHWKWPRHDFVLQNPDHTPLKIKWVYTHGIRWHNMGMGKDFAHKHKVLRIHQVKNQCFWPILEIHGQVGWVRAMSWPHLHQSSIVVARRPKEYERVVWNNLKSWTWKMKWEVEVQNAVLCTVRHNVQGHPHWESG